MALQEQKPSTKPDGMEQSDRAANALMGSIGNTLGVCDVDAPRVGRALRDLFIADTKLYFAPLTFVASIPARLLRALSQSASEEKR